MPARKVKWVPSFGPPLMTWLHPKAVLGCIPCLWVQSCMGLHEMCGMSWHTEAVHLVASADMSIPWIGSLADWHNQGDHCTTRQTPSPRGNCEGPEKHTLQLRKGCGSMVLVRSQHAVRWRRASCGRVMPRLHFKKV